jgi:hypothetical protein
VADASISVGAVILFIGIWVMERAEKKKKEDAEDSPPAAINEVISE